MGEFSFLKCGGWKIDLESSIRYEPIICVIEVDEGREVRGKDCCSDKQREIWF